MGSKSHAATAQTAIPVRRNRVRLAKHEAPKVPLAAVFSFLKETRGMVTWTTRDLAATLLISNAAAGEVIPYLSMQGYVRATAKDSEWLTTMAGENVSASATPRFSREAVQRALGSLGERIKEFNRNHASDYAIKNAVAFGDFLGDRPRVQAADVGIELERKSAKTGAKFAAASERALELDLLRDIRGRSPLFHLRRYEPWMKTRTHRKIV